jgi:hypothetical protein
MATQGTPTISSLAGGGHPVQLVASVDAPDLVDAIAFGYSSESAPDFTDIGMASRVPGTDVYELTWDTSQLPTGTYRLQASVVGGDDTDNVAVVVDNSKQVARLDDPRNGAVATFHQRSTRLSGIASPGTHHVDLFYAAPSGPKAELLWTRCGSVTPLEGDAERPFSGTCVLEGGASAFRVSRVGALAYAQTCDVMGCSSTIGTGDVHRVIGSDERPVISIDPAESESTTDSCFVFQLTVWDEDGSPVPGQAVDVSVAGPTSHTSFCDPSGLATSTSHEEGSTDAAGRFSFGVISPEGGEGHLAAWIDQSEDDVQGATEPSDAALIHWIPRSDCTITGTPGDDVLRGTSGADTICGVEGDDLLRGFGGKDILIGGLGSDLMIGGTGDDLLTGGAGRDRFKGGADEDQCDAHAREAARGCEPEPSPAARDAV